MGRKEKGRRETKEKMKKQKRTEIKKEKKKKSGSASNRGSRQLSSKGVTVATYLYPRLLFQKSLPGSCTGDEPTKAPPNRKTPFLLKSLHV